MKSTTRLLLTGLVLGLLVLAGCQQEPVQEPMNDTAPVSEDNNMEEEEPEAEIVEVTLTEDSLEIDPSSVEAGLVKFEISNDGELYNEFAVQTSDATVSVEDGIDAGASAELEIELKSGEYKVFSPIPGREERGLVAQLTVE